MTFPYEWKTSTDHIKPQTKKPSHYIFIHIEGKYIGFALSILYCVQQGLALLKYGQIKPANR